MNKFFKLIFMLPMLLFVASCSNDDELEGIESGQTEATKGVSRFDDVSDIFQPIHTDLLRDLLAGKQAMTFSFNGYEEYKRWGDEKKFEYFDLTGWYGWSCSMPMEIIFSEGKVWAPYSTFSNSTGPTMIGMAWNAYMRASGEQASLYVGQDFKFTEADRSVHFLGRDFVMLMFNRNNMIVSETTEFWRSHPDNHELISGDCIHIVSYKRTADVAMLQPDAIGFATNEDVAAYIIAKCRAFFGDVINLNEVYAPEVMLDDPYINLDELEKSVAAGHQKGDY